MPATLDSLAHDALTLPADQRMTLACRLLVSVEPEPEPGADAAWDAEISRRIARFDAGETQAMCPFGFAPHDIPYAHRLQLGLDVV